MVSSQITIMALHIMVALTCLASSMAIAQPTPAAAEFSDLMKSLMVPVGPPATPPDWSLGEHPALRWKSATPQPSEVHLARDELPMARLGVVHVTVDGKITHKRADRPGQPGQWNVVLAGSRSAPLEARLDMHDPAGASGWAANLKAAGFKVKALCKAPFVSSGTAVYAIEAAGYRPALLAEEWSAGSAGTSTQLTIAYTKQRAEKLQCM
jgi:hypothetical protein